MRKPKSMGCLWTVGIVLLASWMLVAGTPTTVSQIPQAPYEPQIVSSQPARDKLVALNRLIEEMLEILRQPTLDWSAFEAKLEEMFTLFDASLNAFPDVYGVSFLEAFYDLFDVHTAMDRMAALWDDGVRSPFTYFLELAAARGAKEDLEWSLAAEQLAQQLTCAGGRRLLVAYPGFGCADLLRAISEAHAAGACVTITWREAQGYRPPLSGPATYGPNQLEVIQCLTHAGYHAGPTIEMRLDADPGDERFDKVDTFGDADTAVHVSSPPSTPHRAYADSTLAVDTDSRGNPVRPTAGQSFQPGDVLYPWFRVADLRSAVDVSWRVLDPMGTPIQTLEQNVDPARYNTDSLNFSSSGWLQLDAAFPLAGTYSVELWMGGVYSALHTFEFGGAANQPPVVSDDFYVTLEDTPIDNPRPVIENDADPNLEPLTVVVLEPPAKGTVYLQSTGSFQYMPGLNACGVDSFTYSATDPNGLSASGTVTILVEPVNDPPVARPDLFLLEVPVTGEGSAPNGARQTLVPTPGVLLNDVDPDHDPLIAVLDLQTPLPSGIELEPDGSLSFENIIDLPSTITFRYYARDPAGEQTLGAVEVRVEGGI